MFCRWKTTGNASGVGVLAEEFQAGRPRRIADIASDGDGIHRARVENGNGERKLTKVRKCEAGAIGNGLLVSSTATPATMNVNVALCRKHLDRRFSTFLNVPPPPLK